MNTTLRENIDWVGCVDWTVRDFHSYNTDRGATYNAYLIRDEKTAFFFSRIPQGTHKITYLLRAEVPGTFNALPTSGYAMYVPDIRATSDEMRIQIADKE